MQVDVVSYFLHANKNDVSYFQVETMSTSLLMSSYLTQNYYDQLRGDKTPLDL